MVSEAPRFGLVNSLSTWWRKEGESFAPGSPWPLPSLFLFSQLHPGKSNRTAFDFASCWLECPPRLETIGMKEHALFSQPWNDVCVFLPYNWNNRALCFSLCCHFISCVPTDSFSRQIGFSVKCFTRRGSGCFKHLVLAEILRIIFTKIHTCIVNKGLYKIKYQLSGICFKKNWKQSGQGQISKIRLSMRWWLWKWSDRIVRAHYSILYIFPWDWNFP